MTKTVFKKSILVILGLTLTVACSTSDSTSGAQKIKGSDTVLPISQKAAEVFNENNPKNSISVTGGGSGVGITALLNGTTDIAQTSRPLKFIEKQKFKDQGKSVEEVIVAYDALSVIVHPSNKVSQLTRKQLEGIFTGKIKNWKELGGANMKIIPYARQTSSGTYEFFKEHVLDSKSYLSGMRSMPANGAIVQSVSQTKGAIGYVGLAYVNADIKPLSISFDGGKNYIEPTFKNAQSKRYPIVRPLYYYYLTGNGKKVQKFIHFIVSTKGQKIVSEIGFIPISQ